MIFRDKRDSQNKYRSGQGITTPFREKFLIKSGASKIELFYFMKERDQWNRRVIRKSKHQPL